MKLGLASIMIVIGLYYLDVKICFCYYVKNIFNNVIAGTFSMFAYGFVGALLSYICMVSAFKVLKKISLIGISMIGGSCIIWSS